jgi:hypothetical protein
MNPDAAFVHDPEPTPQRLVREQWEEGRDESQHPRLVLLREAR